MSYFKAYLGAANELPSTLEKIPHTLPAISATTLDIKFKNFFALWLYYFNYKHPNLQFLRLDISIGYHNWWPAVLTQDVTYTYPLNPNRLQHLETLKLIIEEISMRTHLVFWQFIYPLKAPIKNLKYIATSSHSTAQHYAANVKSFLQSFSETLETFSVEGKLFFYIKQCPELELSFSLMISGSISKETRCLILNMSYTFFKVVCLAHIRYCLPYKRRDEDLATNLTLLSQLTDSLLLSSLSLSSSLTATNIDHKEVDPKSLAVVTYRNIAWFHTFLDVVFEMYIRIGIRQLLEHEASTAVEYYQSFQSNRNNKARRRDKQLDGDTLMKDWKDNLCKGYGELKRGQVEKYILSN
ncbi:hypothetical protein F4703DRAFT_1793903 [Phycomyces blakesleeanus]